MTRLERQLYLLASVLSTGWVLSTANVSQAQLTGTNPDEFQQIEQPLPLKATMTTLGIGLIGFELWWFLFSRSKSKPEQAAAEQAATKPDYAEKAVLLGHMPVAPTQARPLQTSEITDLDSRKNGNETSPDNRPPEKFVAELCTLYSGIEMARSMLMVEHRIQPRFSMG